MVVQELAGGGCTALLFMSTELNFLLGMVARRERGVSRLNGKLFESWRRDHETRVRETLVWFLKLAAGCM